MMKKRVLIKEHHPQRTLHPVGGHDGGNCKMEKRAA